jgi:hypothetical protein
MRALLAAGLLMLMAVPALAGAPTVHFAGYDWLVRTYGGGPGPNHWRAANVTVDAAGLHLAIARDGEVWTAAEVVMLGPPLGFGTYEFSVAGDLAALAPNIVLGLFNFPGSDAVGPAGTNEIDIELTQWGSGDNPHRLNWTVHPPVPGPGPAHLDAPFPATAPLTTHRFAWSPTAIAYASFDGPPDGPPAARWTYAPPDPARTIPQRPLVVHVNFWLLDGLPPADGRPAAITLADFRFTPG